MQYLPLSYLLLPSFPSPGLAARDGADPTPGLWQFRATTLRISRSLLVTDSVYLLVTDFVSTLPTDFRNNRDCDDESPRSTQGVPGCTEASGIVGLSEVCFTVGSVILSRWDWNQVVWQTPWKGVLTFLAWPVLSAQPYIYRSESDLHCLMRTAWRAAGVPVSH